MLASPQVTELHLHLHVPAVATTLLVFFLFLQTPATAADKPEKNISNTAAPAAENGCKPIDNKEAETSEQVAPDTECEAGREDGEDLRPWVDSSHDFVTTQADALAGWLDGFFGSQRRDLEAARSFLRLQFQNEWDEEEGNEFKTRLRGKIDLPRLDERLGLIFSDESGEQDTVSEDIDRLLDEEKQNTDVALQYTGLDADRSRLDFKIGLPSFKLKLGMRYRYKYPFSEKHLGRFTEDIVFRDGDGFSSTTRLELDNLLKEDLLLRWSNRFRFDQDSEGVEWNSTLGLSQRIDDKQAISVFASVSGKTRPDFISKREAERLPGEFSRTDESPGWLTEAYGVGALYRINFFRSWLFVEIEPAILWRRRYERNDNREPVGVLTARLEILFDREHSGK